MNDIFESMAISEIICKTYVDQLTGQVTRLILNISFIFGTLLLFWLINPDDALFHLMDETEFIGDEYSHK